MRWLCWALLALCSIAWAQERQVVPLRYELWWDEVIFRRANRFEQTAPGDAKLPPFNEPRFFSCTFGGTKRLFVLAEQKGDFILLADTNGNNDLTDERPFTLRQRGYGRVFGPIPMKLQVNGRTLVRYIGVELEVKPDGEPFLFLLAASRWTGKMEWEGKTVPVTVVDGDVDGLVSEEDTLILGDEGESRDLPPVGQIGVNGRFFRYHIPPTGEHLVFETVRVDKTATVRFDGESLRLVAEGEGGKWLLEGQNGQLIAPVGEFRLGMVELLRKDDNGRVWRLRADAYGPAAPTLKISEPEVTLNLEPLKASLIYARKGDEFEFSLDLKTANGMSVRGLMVGFQLPPEPVLKLTAPDGKVIAEERFHYG